MLRDVVRRCHMMRKAKRPDQISLMQQFEAMGWLTRLDRNGSIPRWRRTKGLGTRFAEDLAREIERRKELTRIIKVEGAKRKAENEDED